MPAEHNNNLSLARQQPSQVHLSKATRQVVPAFLQKLFEMVNDPSNADLIRWSDAGDSFFVLDHERFARQVLGRWFKHQNFSSFVRQLNMYGFHKIPHLQQGVLRSDQEAEFWNFEHPNFHRGQPDLLCLIQRKKQAPQSNDLTNDSSDPNPQSTSSPPTNPDPSPATATLGNGQVLDIHSIINGIAAIKRHQTTISAELNQLKRSNQLLWQESLAARQRHQKHQDTINRILKFLAGVFGNGGGHAKDGVVAGAGEALGMGMGMNGPMGTAAMGMQDPTRPEGYHRAQVQRLMIEEGPNAGKRKMPVVQVEEEDDNDDDDAPYLRDVSPVSMRSAYNEPMSPTISEAPYINLTTPTPSLTPPRDKSSTPQIIMQPKPSPSRALPTANSLAAALSPALSLSSSSNGSNSTTNGNSNSTTNGNSGNGNTTALTTLSPSPPLPVLNGANGDQDSMIQAFQQMLSSPGQIQRLLAALSAHNNNNTNNNNGVGSGLPAPLPQQIQQQQQQQQGQMQGGYGGGGGGGGGGGYGYGLPGDHYTPSGQLSLLTPSPPPSLSHLSSMSPIPPMNGGMGNMANGGMINGNMANGGMTNMGNIGNMGNMGVSALDAQTREEREQQQRLEKTWKVTQDIDKDVNALHSSIESLIGAFGLDPGLMAGAGAGGNVENGGGVSGGGQGVSGQGGGVGVGGNGVGGMDDLAVPEFDFDAFLNEYGNTGMGVGGMNGMGAGGLAGVGGIGGDGDVDMELGNGMNGGMNGMGGGFLDEDGTVGNGNGSVVGSPVISFASASNGNGNGVGNGIGNGGDGNGASSKKAKMNGHAHASSISSVSSMTGIEPSSSTSTTSTSTTTNPTAMQMQIPTSPTVPSKIAPVSPKATKGRKRKSDAAEIEDMQRGMGGSALGALGALAAGAAAAGAAGVGVANGVNGVNGANANGNGVNGANGVNGVNGGVGGAGGTGKRKR
ncbi:stress-responsive transcription factor hsf1 [Pleurotus pulmonarius]|nr:stress-responsive transcription factor hsf1 [Pleurotus pulmonarius]